MKSRQNQSLHESNTNKSNEQKRKRKRLVVSDDNDIFDWNINKYKEEKEDDSICVIRPRKKSKTISKQPVVDNKEKSRLNGTADSSSISFPSNGFQNLPSLDNHSPSLCSLGKISFM